MALPEDVTTCLLDFGPYTDASGEPVMVGVTGKIRPSVPLIRHVASGSVVINHPIPVTIDSFGSASVVLVHTDLAALSPQGFTYTVEWDVASRKPSPGNKRFALPAAVGANQDFDQLEQSEDVPGVHVPVGVASDSALVALLNDTSSATYARLIELIAARAGFGGLAP